MDPSTRAPSVVIANVPGAQFAAIEYDNKVKLTWRHLGNMSEMYEHLLKRAST